MIMEKRLKNELQRIVAKWLQWSLKLQDEVFNSSRKNRKLFEKAKSLANF